MIGGLAQNSLAQVHGRFSLLMGAKHKDQVSAACQARFRVDQAESSGSDCSMGMSFMGKGVNPSYTQRPLVHEGG